METCLSVCNSAAKPAAPVGIHVELEHGMSKLLVTNSGGKGLRS